MRKKLIVTLLFIFIVILSLPLGLLSVWTSNLNDQILVYWRFNEGSGTNVLDAVNNNLNLSTNNNPTWQGGILNNSLFFERGQLQWANTTENISISGADSWSIGVWGNITTVIAGASHTLLRIGAPNNNVNGCTLAYDDGGARWRFCEIFIDNSIVPGAGMKFHVVTYNTTTIQWYVNGSLINSTATVLDINNSLMILARDDSNLNHWNGTIDEMGVWNRTLTSVEVTDLYNDGVGITFDADAANPGISIDVTLDSPPNGTLTSQSVLGFNGSFFIRGGNLTNATLFLYLPNNTLFNTNFTVLTTGNSSDGITNSTNLTLSGFNTIGDWQWNYFACGRNETVTLCNFSSSNFTFTLGLINNSHQFNATTFETASESYTLNISQPGDLSVSSATLVYNDTNFAGTVTSSGTETIATTTFTIPVSLAGFTTNLFWNIVYDNGQQENTSIETQVVNAINLSLCSAAPQNVQFLNFTFQNETTAAEVTNASIASSEWTYWLHERTVNRTLSFSNAGELPNYAFCFTPADRELNVDLKLNYINIESQQRTFKLENSLLTNLTTNQVLLLMPNILGLFTRYRVVDVSGNAISNVLASVTRVISGSNTQITSDLTDSSGQVIFFLNPDLNYNYAFTKEEFTDNIFSLQPNSADTYTVTMSLLTGGTVNGTQISLNTTYQTFPLNSSLNNNTDYTFGLNVTSSQSVSLISMNITNSSGFQLLFNSNAGVGFIDGIVNTENNSFITGAFVIQTGNETISFSRVWIVGEEFIGDYSLFRQLSLFMDYEFSDFIRMLLVLAIITGTLIFLSSNELVESSESKIAVSILLIWAFSIVGWLDAPIALNSANSNISTLAQFGKQYGIAMLSTMGGVLFMFRRIFT